MQSRKLYLNDLRRNYREKGKITEPAWYITLFGENRLHQDFNINARAQAGSRRAMEEGTALGVGWPQAPGSATYKVLFFFF